MSRAVVSTLELAAAELASHNIRVGAYGCGIYGGALDASKKIGFMGWQKDPVCMQFGRSETPNTHVVVEALSGNIGFRERAASFSAFYAAVSPNALWHVFLLDTQPVLGSGLLL